MVGESQLSQVVLWLLSPCTLHKFFLRKKESNSNTQTLMSCNCKLPCLFRLMIYGQRFRNYFVSVSWFPLTISQEETTQQVEKACFAGPSSRCQDDLPRPVTSCLSFFFACSQGLMVRVLSCHWHSAPGQRSEAQSQAVALQCPRPDAWVPDVGGLSPILTSNNSNLIPKQHLLPTCAPTV